MFFSRIFNSQKAKTHNFQRLEKNVDYFVDFSEFGKSATLTTSWTIKSGDIVTLSYQDEATQYYVEAVDWYWNDDDIRTALLKRINLEGKLEKSVARNIRSKVSLQTVDWNY